jgi:PAS domain S-box-containing protein
MNIMNLVHPDDREEIEEVIRRQTENLDNPQTAEFRANIRDGQIFCVEATSLGVLFGGEQCLMVILRDITDRNRQRPDDNPSGKS